MVAESGKSSMCQKINATEDGVGVTYSWYWKTAGDLLQSFWAKKKVLTHQGQFGYNEMQARVSDWLHLPFLICEDSSNAQQISCWQDHGRADFHETVTLLLPPHLLNLYLMVTASFCRYYGHHDEEKCEAWKPREGVCWKKKRQGQRFCCQHMSHEPWST